MKNFLTPVQFILYLVFIIAAFPLNTLAQAKSKEINNQSQTWVSVNSTVRLNKKLGIIADVHLRRNNFIAGPGFYFVRAGVNYWLKDNITIAAGYGHLWQAPAKPNWHHYANESRIYQQIQLVSKIGKTGLLHRIRNEQRWQEKIINDTFTHQYKFTNRVRYLFSMNIPVFKNIHYPSLILSDELAIQFGKEIVFNTFDQNRAFIGIKQPVSQSISFDFGYMLVYQQKASGYQYDRNHTLRCFFYYTPDFRLKHS